jgi:hypothetical protein
MFCWYNDFLRHGKLFVDRFVEYVRIRAKRCYQGVSGVFLPGGFQADQFLFGRSTIADQKPIGRMND